MKRIVSSILKRWYIIALLFALLVQGVFLSHSRSSAERLGDFYNLSGVWKFTFEDSPEFANPGYDDSAWDTVTLPGSLIRKSMEQKGTIEGVCWVRKRVDFKNKTETGKLGLILGRIGDADQTYFNGVMVGGLGDFSPDRFSMWNHPRNYPIPETLVNQDGENVIAVRISYYNICEITGKMAVTDHTSLTRYNASSTFIHVTSGYITIAMGLVLFLIFGYFYAARPGFDECLYFCLLLLFGLPIVLESCTYWNLYSNPETRYKLLGIAWIGENVAHCLFLHRIYRLKRKRVDYALFSYFTIAIALTIVFSGSVLIRGYFPILVYVIIAVYLYSFSCHVSALILNRPNSRVFGFFGIGFVILALHDCILYLSKISDVTDVLSGYEPEIPMNLGIFMLYAGFAVVLIRNFVKMADTVDGLNSDLDTYMRENAKLNKQLEEKARPSVTVSKKSEEKLEKILLYIKDNYREDITRNQLADSIGIHPDSLGKQFKLYTGKKLGDYIYELRIDEAARRLREEDSSITEIAFEVGFESLRTFNRIFPKFMNTSPVKYRKHHQECDPAEIS